MPLPNHADVRFLVLSGTQNAHLGRSRLTLSDKTSHFPALAGSLVAGLVTMRRQGTQRLYRARPEGLTKLRTFLDQFWQDHLQLLKQKAETEERRSQAGESAGR